MPSSEKCVDKLCPSNTLPQEQRGRMFCFPRTNNLRRQWLEIMGRTDLLHLAHFQLLGRGFRICHRHFKIHQFQTPSKKKLCNKQLPQRHVYPDENHHGISGTIRSFNYQKASNNQEEGTIDNQEKGTTDNQEKGTTDNQEKGSIDNQEKGTTDNQEKGTTDVTPISCPSSKKRGNKVCRILKEVAMNKKARLSMKEEDNFKITNGVDEKLLCYLKDISSKMPLRERYCTLIFDGMDIENNVSLTTTEDSGHVKGFVQTGTEQGQNFGDYVLVFMIRGIAKKWKQPIAFYFTHKATNQHTLKSLIEEVVQAVHEKTYFRVVASVCNGDSWNVAALHTLSLSSGHEFVYNIDGHQVIHLFDVPHILKSIRNYLMTNDIEFEGKMAKWDDIHKLYELDGVNSEMFKASALTNAHINPTNCQKLEVKLAAQVFSRSTASFLNILSKTGVMDAAGTAIFVKFMDDLFDSLNSVSSSTKPLACKLTSTSQHHGFWDGARRKLSRLKFISENKCVEIPPTIRLLLATIRNVRYLWDFLKDKGFKNLTLRSLNQDPLENLFSVARELCGATKPSALQFANAYKTIIVNNIARGGNGSNCEDDGEDFLFSYTILPPNPTYIDSLEPFPSESSDQSPSIATTKEQH